MSDADKARNGLDPSMKVEMRLAGDRNGFA